MNIELLEEVKNLLEDGKTIQEVANTIAIAKSSLLLMLRMDYIFSKKYEDDFEFLKSENITLISQKKELETEISLLKFEIQELKNPFLVTPLKIPDFSFLKERNIILDDENYRLLEKNRILKTSLNKIPMFIRKIFI